MSRRKKPFYTKSWFWFALLFFVILGNIINIIIGDSDTKEEVNEAAKSEIAATATAKETITDAEIVNSPEPAEEQATDITPLITKAGGLGDTKEAIEQVLGVDENDSDAGISSYLKNTVLVMYSEDDVTKINAANNVTLSFEATDSGRRTAEEALNKYSTVIPSDAVKVKEYAADEGRDVIQYQSTLLADRLKGYYDFATSLDSELKPGTFIVILKHDDSGIFSVVVAAGNNP
ncbi:hypothetical protein [Paenibacillus etheri]|uniref:Uncharacterized protein n=1 Tax=Paenibacillus etheri TaxID=1306852 RepID=A0A0W1AX67_9BACL|nr:hypothetical protein [Paenibacillus etheri]KTD85969.1 hypothetical protein UQ64_17925 [Paenibacillus etheri]